MDRVDEYRFNETQCRRMLEATTNPKDRADWLKLANSWKQMLEAEQRHPTGVLEDKRAG